MSECPVCYSEIKTEMSYSDYVLCEEWNYCNSCGYSYEFTYGYFLVVLPIRGHKIVFRWSYHDRAPQAAIDVVTLASRKALLEDLLKVKHEDHKNQ